jgi:hypothetical protein
MAAATMVTVTSRRRRPLTARKYRFTSASLLRTLEISQLPESSS